MGMLGRLWRHLLITRWRLHREFTPPVLDRIEQAVHAGEAAHSGEIRFVVETDLDVWSIIDGKTPRQRAIEIFSLFHVWDTEKNNGILIYLLLADRDVEIVADRGYQGRVEQAEWDAVCRAMEEHYRASRWEQGSLAGVDGVTQLLVRHFPFGPGDRARDRNELPDRPTLL
jgi:uncharacterized membrane protein